jgi:hypothetical protein
MPLAKPGGGLGVVLSHAYLARLLADAGGVWEASATKPRFYLATFGAFGGKGKEPSPRTPGARHRKTGQK